MRIKKYLNGKLELIILIAILFSFSSFASSGLSAETDLNKLPVVFRKNVGQWDSQILFRGTSFSWNADVYFMKERLCYVFSKPYNGPAAKKTPSLSEEYFEEMMWNMEFLNPNLNASIDGDGIEESHSNYFLGNDASRYVANVPDYKMVKYSNLYTGVDLNYYSVSNKLKYDIVIKPNGNISDLKFKFNGVNNISKNESGDIEIETIWGTLIESLPESYQIINGKKKLVNVSFELLDGNILGFKVSGNYNKSYNLVIDPINLQWRTYVGGLGNSNGYHFDMTTDSQGNAVCTGYFNGIFNFTKAVSAGFDQVYNGGADKAGDAIVYKISRDGKKLLWATYVGGNDQDWATSLKLNSSDDVFVSGYTMSTDFPVTAGAYNNGGVYFAFRLNASGSNLIYSSKVGGSLATTNLPAIPGCINSIAINNSDEAVVCASTASGAITPNNPLQATYGGGTSDMMFVRLSSNGQVALNVTYYGGSGDDAGLEINSDAAGNFYVAGSTGSNNFPVTAGCYDNSFNGGTNDVVLLKIDPNFTSVIYSTYLGGASSEYPVDIEIPASGEAHIVGYTNGNSVPTTASAYRKTATNRHGFVTRFNSTGTGLIYSTYIGTGNAENATGIELDKLGNAYVVGYANSGTPITACAYQSTPQGLQDIFLCKFDVTGSVLLFGTIIGGDKQDYQKPRISLIEGTCENDTIVGGITTHSGLFPTPYWANSGEVYMPTNQSNGGDYDQHAVYKLVPPEPVANFYYSQNVQCNIPVQFTDSTYGPCVNWTVNWKPTSWSWNFGDGSTSTQQNPIHVYSEAGTYQVTLTIGCPSETITKTVVVNPGQNCNVDCYLSSNVTTTTASCGNADGTAQISSAGAYGNLTFVWTPLSNADSIANDLSPGSYVVIITDTMNCKDTVTFTITTPNGPSLDSLVKRVTCPAGSDGAVDLIINGGASPYAVSWSNGALTEDLIGLAPGTYSVSVTDANNCMTTLTAIVPDTVLLPMSVTLPADTLVCMTANINLQPMVSGGNGVYSYTWSTGSANNNVLISPVSTTTVSVSVDDGCGSGPVSDEIIISVKPAPIVNFTANDTDGCSPVCVQFTDLTNPAGGICQWTFGDGSLSDVCGQNNHCYTTPGLYDVTLTVDDGLGCISTFTKNDYISVYGYPEADFVANPQPTTIYDPMIYFTDLSSDAVSWSWDFGDSTNSVLQNPSHLYDGEVPDSYSVTLIVENVHGCFDTIVKTIEIKSDWTIFVPNSFTPNGDGKNDLFKAVGTGIEEFEMYIYDRWGNEIFKSNDINKPWDGKVLNGSGQLVQIDTYVWLIRFKDNTLQSHFYTGHVNMLR